ncbi:hypothetical protein N7457_007931 [Penicillium paradoxum]|uniref:uncharacterized protein n=1 Tax=Penicillium paradoxum TaxID=176176 RepID=UPI0025470A38|nr:uncharacterized protein N7457_007931 [Penicillium paradoxum]KAJ5773035.1 hypothetical protein N7457_007931 [Penicillium paradoxum]
MMATGSRDASVREAKLFVKEVVRNDWDFETGVPSPSSASGTLCHNREVCEWRVREFDMPTSELEPPNSDSEDDYHTSAVMTPPSGDAGIERRRKRRRQQDDEMAWNEGLRLWMARRDAWCGAKTRRQIRAENEKRAIGEQMDTTAQLNGTESEDSGVISPGTSLSGTASGRRSDGTGASDLAVQTETSLSIADRGKSESLQHRADMTSGQQADQEESLSTAPEEEAKRKASSETNITEPNRKSAAVDPTRLTTLSAVEDQTEEEKEEDELDEPLIPVAPPSFRMTTRFVVVQGMTPTVPVNLAHLTKAMVQGWKADGQWPPKPAVTSIVLADDASVPKKPEPSEEAPPQGRRKNSITNAVKKVFQFGAHSFHRRASGSQDTGHGAGAPGSTA